MIKRGFKYAFGTTLVTSSLVLLSHGHAFAATNDTDNQFNHDANGNPITVQSDETVDPGFNHDVDANNNVDSGFNHDVGNNTSENSEENATDSEFNHDANGNPITSGNHFPENNSPKTTPQDPSKSSA
ncbi:hypothetical protein [Staphylococcus sp. Marseille-Q1834]|uniref:hypothetical protein n=1 Tax=Staphylococcus sp. Marseille-Q1834 TaxID=2866594 RepID=UPI001CF8B948|nr:hypothetical protein [Staphylococcus sp. Marseille-Q1834]